jgi:GH35 family endo-1,4-beta-xylanase
MISKKVIALYILIFRVNVKMLKILAIGLLLFLFVIQLNAQMADGKCRFLGNIIAYSIPSSFNTYWNKVTPENAGKWGSVEASRDNMSWTNLDRAYNHAINNGFPFKEHTFVWGQQQPGWIGSLSQADQKDEVEEWIKLYGERYPLTYFIDVVNEPLHAVPNYSAALGGSGTTGWDWVVWSFEKAREYCPNAKLHLNDYGIIGSTSATNQYLEIINILIAKDLIDGIGVQGHGLENADTATLRANLDKLAETGLPIYITEYDVNLANDADQYLVYFNQFPIFWTHPGVAGITLWGYIQNQIWKANAYLLRTDGSERPALSWLKTYVMATDTDCPTLDIEEHVLHDNMDISVYPNPVSDGRIMLELADGISGIRLFDTSGREVKNIQVYGQSSMTLELDVSPGLYFMQFISEQKPIVERLCVN